jgi:hypothetical protein
METTQEILHRFEIQKQSVATIKREMKIRLSEVRKVLLQNDLIKPDDYNDFILKEYGMTAKQKENKSWIMYTKKKKK